MLPQLRVHVTHHKESAEARDRFECRLELGEVTADQRERLLHIAQRCPVHLLLERGADLPTIAASEEQGPLAA
jgi:putative redox protein